MTRYKTRKINITYCLSKRRQRCETDSWWQTVPWIYHTLSKKILPHTTGTSRSSSSSSFISLKIQTNIPICQYMSRTDKAMLLQLPYRNKEQIKTNAILWKRYKSMNEMVGMWKVNKKSMISIT